MSKSGIAVLAGFALSLGAAPAPQQQENCVAWAKSWEDAKMEAVERNVPILFTIQQDENPGCKQMEGSFRDGSFIQASRRVVCVVANPDVKHGIREVMIAGKKTPLCRAYDGMVCETHVGCQQVIGNFIKEGDFGIPTQIWCRPDGTELFKLTGSQGETQSPAALIKDMERALDRVSGPKMNRTEWVDHRSWLRDGDDFQAKMEYKKSITLFKKCSESKYPKFAAMGKDRVENLMRACTRLVNEALKQYEKYPGETKEAVEKRKEAKNVLTKISKDLKGTEAGDKADEALKKIK